MERAQLSLHLLEGRHGDRDVIRSVELLVVVAQPLGVSQLQGRSEPDRGAAAQLFGGVVVLDDCEQRADELVVDDHRVARQVGREQQLLLRRAGIAQGLKEPAPGLFRPVPGSDLPGEVLELLQSELHRMPR